MSMDFDAFSAAIDAFAEANHISIDLAADLMAEIGDTPMMNDAGTHVIARGREWVWPTEDTE